MTNLDNLTIDQLDKLKGTPKSTLTKDKDWAMRGKVNQAKWRDHTTGNAYMLIVQNRTANHSFRVQQYGRNVFQAVRRYYRGLDSKDNWRWQCTKVVAVYDCIDQQTGQSGKLLIDKRL